MKLTLAQRVERARLFDLYSDAVDLEDFVLIDGEWTLDGMIPAEWFEAVYGE